MRAPRRGGPAGQALVLFALSLVGLLSVAGLVVDLGGAWAQLRTEQKVADIAALAGATAEANGQLNPEIIQTAIDSVVANGYLASEVTVNIPPTSGDYAPGGAYSGALSTNDCSTLALFPCWIEVTINRAHSNSFSRVVGFDSFGVSARGVAVGGIANTITNGASPIMFNYEAITKHPFAPTVYCDPHPSKCSPNSSWPTLPEQFAWTTFCMTPDTCNVNSADAMAIIDGGGFQFDIFLNMYLGPHNNGSKTSVCHTLTDAYPNGGDLSVAINDDDGKLIGFWVWHLDTAGSDCEGTNGEQLRGWFVNDITNTLPLTITAGGSAATFGLPTVNLVE